MDDSDLRKYFDIESYSTIEDFEEAIKEHEDQLFGIWLFNKGIKQLYKDDKYILDYNAIHFTNIVQRGRKAISDAKVLLTKVRNGTEDIKALKDFVFPPIHGAGLDGMTIRAQALIKTYERIFPDKPRYSPLTVEENEKLMQEVVKDF